MNDEKKIFEPITNEQIANIHARSKDIGLSKENLYHFIEKTIGIGSITALSKQEAAFVINELYGQLQFPFPIPARSANIIGPTADQLPYLRHVVGIRQIVKAIGWDKDHFKEWLKKYMKVSSIRELDRKRASETFVALRKIQSHREKENKMKTGSVQVVPAP